MRTIILIFSFLLPLAGKTQTLQKHQFSYPKMGTQFRLTLYTIDTLQAKKLAEKSFRKVDALNAIFSDYDPTSELSQLSKSAGTGQKVKVSKELWAILKMSKKFYGKSNGAFDITIGPLSKLWRSMIRQQKVFDEARIQQAKSKVGFEKIKFYPFSRKVQLTTKGMRLDLGGIAKGYTVDAIVAILKKHNIRQFMVDGGGDLYVGAAPPQQSAWFVKTLARKEGLKPTTIPLTHTAIASSGDTYRFIEWKGVRYSHIVDPRTGYGVTDRKIINVQAKNCAKADAIASILNILVGEEYTNFIKKEKGFHVF
ncbi:MAG: FAD:protein FMN transferase [Bacteroidota bacterium]